MRAKQASPFLYRPLHGIVVYRSFLRMLDGLKKIGSFKNPRLLCLERAVGDRGGLIPQEKALGVVRRQRRRI